ncbi:DUF2793 domain-containing protein [Oceanibium sediminis]|uniref:DUF2793 domain-containing protein n=1 Tax=Oceanibium sediminis TaxID=2026339 RepID=UPI000DD4114D|nr:DUF2793 domain-containing protein [Oceanibium sediminis]
MSETFQFQLPLLAGGQAQKHVTVNEALARLDAVAQLRVISDQVTAPPAAPQDGAAYIVPPGAGGAWAGAAGQIALFANGGWVIVTPKAGWSAWCEATGRRVGFDGQGWIPDAGVISASGAAFLFRIDEVSHDLAPGTSSTVSAAIPGGSVVFGVSGRVTEAITGTVSSWSLGVSGSGNRYGSGLGTGLGSYANGLTGTPITYYGAEDLVLSADSGSFSGGQMLLAVHSLSLVPPR